MWGGGGGGKYDGISFMNDITLHTITLHYQIWTQYFKTILSAFMIKMNVFIKKITLGHTGS